MVNPVIWLSLPVHREALVEVWTQLHLPLLPLDVLADSLQQLGLTTPAALCRWLASLAVGNQRVRLWAYIPPEIQEQAMQELRVDAIIQDFIIRSSATFSRQQARPGGRGPATSGQYPGLDRWPAPRVAELLASLRAPQ